MGSDKLKRILFKGDRIIWVIFITLCAISLIEVFSATSRQTYATGNYWSPIIKHSGFLVGGVIMAWFIHNLEAKWIAKLTNALYWLGLIGLIWAQFQGATINDSSRWIKIMGFTFQPMEIAKMGLVMKTAQILSEFQDDYGTDSRAFWKILKFSALPIILIFIENLSSAVILAATVYLMMFIGRVPKKQLLSTLAIGVVAVGGGICIIMSPPDFIADSDFGKNKLLTWQNRFKDFADSTPVTSEEYDAEENPQKTYSHIAVASSNLLGCGPGNSVQRDFIPHAYSDYIFAVIIEELGLIGAIGVMLLYLALLYRCGKIAKKCDDPYPAFLAMGIGMIIVLQALMHMYISVGNFVTGQPLPLMSQGGTSVIINCIYIGFILSISRYAKQAAGKREARMAGN